MSIPLNIGAPPWTGKVPSEHPGFYDRPLVKRGAKMGPPGVKATRKAKKKLAELPITHNQAA